jgi:predicted ATPase/DNA-binding SARP family transcriptional activator
MPGNDPGSSVRVDVLGPVRLLVDGVSIEVRGPKRRALLALLATSGGRAVTANQLVDALWPGEAPGSGRAALHSQISRLRGHLAPRAGRLVTLDGGYRLELGADELDVARARRLLAEGRATSGANPEGACVLLREALALWRGPPFADMPEVLALQSTVVGLERLHQELTDLLIECAIDAGHVEGLIQLAADALAADPLREPAAALLMRALAMTGRPAEALRTGRQFRRRLSAETGLDPTAELGELEQRIARGEVGPVGLERHDRPQVRPATSAVRPATQLIGREADLAGLRRLLGDERLVTIVGPGGTGKTRLAHELAHEADGPTVLLAPITEPAAIPHALAAALGLQEVHGDVLRTCVSVLAGGPHLLLVDNCEHQLEAVRELVTVLLNGCPELRVVATSREPLGLASEWPFRLGPLALPQPGPHGSKDSASFRQIASVALFLERAARARPGFAPDMNELRLIGDLVRRLDGIPLAIELAAGRLSTFSVSDLGDRLDRALDLLGSTRGDPEARHRTLRSTVQWSYDLLSADEQRLFAQLSVFPVGVDLDSAEYVAGDLGLTGDAGSALAHLVDASMIGATFEGPTRYRMLETVRAFGLDRLAAAGEDKTAAGRLLRWAIHETAWIHATMTSEQEPEADAKLRTELPNLRSAWRLARQRPLVDDAATLVMALSDATSWRDLSEMWEWTEELARDPALTASPHVAAVLGCAAGVAYMRGDYRRATRLAGDGLARATDAEASFRCLGPLALADLSRGAYADAVEHALAAADLATRPNENLGIAALALAYGGDLHQGQQLNEQMTAAATSPTLRGFSAYVSGELHNAAGRTDQAEEQYHRAIDLGRSSGATFLVGIASVGLLTVLAEAGRIRDAMRNYSEVIDYWERSGNWTQQWVTVRNLAQLLRRLGDDQAAAFLEAAAEQAPDAPAIGGAARSTGRAPAGTLSNRLRSPLDPGSRRHAIEAARQAIRGNLAED